jgi:hypothetical protein
VATGCVDDYNLVLLLSEKGNALLRDLYGVGFFAVSEKGTLDLG